MFTATQEWKEERRDKNDSINKVSKYEKKMGRGGQERSKVSQSWQSLDTAALVGPHRHYIHRCHASAPCTEGAVPTQNRTLMRICGTQIRPHCLDSLSGSSSVTWPSGISSIYCFKLQKFESNCLWGWDHNRWFSNLNHFETVDRISHVDV